MEDNWRKFLLFEEENQEITIDPGILRMESKKGENSLIGKLQSERISHREVLSFTMTKIWRTSKLFEFVNIGPNLFITKFENQMDKQRALFGHPWLFNNLVLSLKPFIGSTPPSRMEFNTEGFWV